MNLLLYLTFVSLVVGMIDEKPHQLFHSPLVHNSPMYSLYDTPSGDENSTISYNLVISRPDAKTKSSFHLLIFGEKAAGLVGIHTNTSVQYCCVESTAKHPCTVGDVIIKRSAVNDSKGLYLDSVRWSNNDQLQKQIVGNYFVNRTGIYTLLLISCDYEAPSELYIEGNFSWYNPYGYLPGDVYKKLPMSGAFTILYSVVFVIFLVLTLRYRSIMLKMQYALLFVLFVGLLESAAWYFYRLTNNNYGVYSTASLFVVVFIAIVRKTLVHLVVLLLAMGIGTVKWTLGTTRVKLGLLTVFYLFFAFVFQFIAELDAVKKTVIISSALYRLIVVIPLAFFSVSFYYWTLLSLIRTVQQLTLRQQTLKLQLYRVFLGVLSITALLFFFSSLYQIYIGYSKKNKKHSEEGWQTAWLEDALNESLFFFVISAVSFLWRPRANNTHFGYAEFFTEDNEPSENAGPVEGDTAIQLETLTVVGAGELTERRKPKTDTTMKSGYESDREKNIMAGMTNLTEFEKDIIGFELSDDSDEVDIQTQINKLN
eukprot:TRINITY_DN11829_c0_g1_i1.p1 TRINITY_DN11829_c0_g1~~TRINITY_DN11829_c0_g1_i1.p1  ORF type:complete len:539 (-),score=91.39 TRINITY_DN11829_c0_g1_i1:16-1632(-)